MAGECWCVTAPGHRSRDGLTRKLETALPADLPANNGRRHHKDPDSRTVLLLTLLSPILRHHEAGADQRRGVSRRSPDGEVSHDGATTWRVRLGWMSSIPPSHGV